MERLSAEKLKELRAVAQWGVDFAARSRSRSLTRSRGQLHVAAMGIEPPSTPLDIGGAFLLRKVEAPPGIVHLVGKNIDGDAVAMAIARQMEAVTAELVFFDEKPDSSLELLWQLAALLKLRGHQIYCPASSTVPWDSVAGAEERSVRLVKLDDTPARIVVRPPQVVSEVDGEWIDAHYEAALRLRNRTTSRRFALAFNTMYSWSHTADPRVALTMLWVALEALFGDQRDAHVTQALVNRITAWIPGASAGKIRSLYALRSDAVHGREFAGTMASETVRETDELLRRALMLAIERRRVPLPDWVSARGSRRRR